ncbi:MAG: hypothetical protein ABJP70_11545 [Erythrobacter sp.]
MDKREANQLKMLRRLALAARDFRHALSAATFLLEDVDFASTYTLEEVRRFKCYETTMVVAYGRAFTASHGAGTGLSWKSLSIAPTASQKGLHEKLMKQRHKNFAHSDATFIDSNLEIWRNRMPNGENFEFIASSTSDSLHFEGHEILNIYNWLRQLRFQCDEALQGWNGPRDALPTKNRP